MQTSKRVCSTALQVCREGEGEGTINNIKPFHYIQSQRVSVLLKCSKIGEVTASWVRLFHNLIADKKMNTGEN